VRKGRSTAARTPKKPADADSGALLVRTFAIKLFDRGEGEAIAETLFKAAFDALDKSPDDASRAALLRRVNTRSYDRLVADPAASKTQALTGQTEAAHADLQSPGPGCRCVQEFSLSDFQSGAGAQPRRSTKKCVSVSREGAFRLHSHFGYDPFFSNLLRGQDIVCALPVSGRRVGSRQSECAQR
jgi:hypothetical protein